MQPLFYAALAAAAGIGAAAAGWDAPAWAAVTLLATTVGLAATERRKWAAIAGLAFCFAGAGWRTTAVLHRPARLNPLEQVAAALQPKARERMFVTGYVRDVPQVLYDHGQPGMVRLDLEAVSAGRTEADPQPRPVSGGVRFEAFPPASATGTGWLTRLLALQAGDGIAASVHLKPIEVYRDPGAADFAATARRQGVAMKATLPDSWRRWPAGHAEPLVRLRARMWRRLSSTVDAMAPPAQQPRVNALLRGMLLGDEARLDETTRTDFQIDGVYHLLVVAGLHIGVLAAMLWWGFRRLRLPWPAAAAASLLLLSGYAWIIAGRTPTLRALLMLTVYFGARLWHRERQALNAVGAAALLLLAVHPLDLFAAGFQLSFGAATLLAGIALPLFQRTSQPLRRATRQLDNLRADDSFAPKLAQWRLDLRALATRLGWFWRPLGWRLMPGAIRAGLAVYEILAISLLLQTGLIGLNLVYFHRANPWSVAANTLLVPAASLLIPAAWATLGLGAVSHAAFEVAAGGVSAGAHGLLAVAAVMARWPGATRRVPSPPGWCLVLLAAGIAIWLAAMARERSWRVWAGAAGVCAAAAVAMAAIPFAPRLPPGLTATVLDVGQGDSIFVTFPDGRTLLVDGGPRTQYWDSGQQIVEPFLWSLGLRHIDAVLLTHAHMDHLGGLDAVVRDFRPQTVWVTRTLPGGSDVAQFLAAVRASGARLRQLSAGDAFLAGASRLQVLLPPPDYHSGEIASNDDSMVVRVSWGADAMMLEGDAQLAGEHWMVDQHAPLASALLKVGHHGSKTSSSQAFLAEVHPKVAVISVGAGNSYGHPAPEVVARLEADGARVFRTDEDGAVQCRMEGGTMRVFLFLQAPGQGRSVISNR